MHDVFRDPTEGALEKRRDLLRRRREELATMPHAVRRVVVARAARTAASIALAVVGGVLIAAAWSPAVAHAIVRALPGADPAPISTLLIVAWVAGLAAYGMSRARAEHRFAVEMSRAVLPGADLDDDLERLSHERPDELARRRAHALEVRSAAWPVLAAALIGPATLVYLGQALRAHGWPSIAGYDDAMTAHAGGLVAGAVLGLAVAALTTRPLVRRGNLAPAAQLLVLLATGGLVAGPAALAVAGRLVLVLAATIACVVWRLERERALIAVEDPAAGSELFTLRGCVRGLRQALAAVVAFGRRHHGARVAVIVAGLGAVAFGAVYAGTWEAAHRAARAAAAVPIVAAPPAATDLGVLAVPVGATRVRAPAVNADRVHLVFPDGKPVVIGSLLGLTAVPDGWTIDVHVRRLDADPDTLPGTLLVSLTRGSTPTALRPGSEERFVANACDHAVPLELVVAPSAGGGPHEATLDVTATLTFAACRATTP